MSRPAPRGDRAGSGRPVLPVARSPGECSDKESHNSPKQKTRSICLFCLVGPGLLLNVGGGGHVVL